jgi:hypothetical protein
MVFGYQDPETGIFQPMVREVPDATTPATTGTIQLALTIKLLTPLPANGSVVCGASLLAESLNLTTVTGSTWTEDAFSVATVNSSGVATCTVNVPYSWVVPAKSSTVLNSITGDYSIEMSDAAGKAPGVVRMSSGTFLSGAIPSGTNKYTLSLTI